jgi:adenine phosphoribosyltransferase
MSEQPLSLDDFASPEAVRLLTAKLRTIVDFPKPGIRFKDITPLLGDARALRLSIDLLSGPFVGRGIDKVVGIEARGFIFGTAVADRLAAGFVPVRKPGKLPAEVDEVSYALEYGEGKLQLHKAALSPGESVLIIDDLLATGGTAAATASLVTGQGARIAAYGFVCELDFLPGRAKLAAATDADVPIYTLIKIGEGD